MDKPFAASADVIEAAARNESFRGRIYNLIAEGNPNVRAPEGEDSVIAIEATPEPGGRRKLWARLEG